ncbi:hypothetical protein C7451_101450 [Blastomonas natatoria]|uniref:Lipoprotein n=1 Tax=Blastomonas natatoria TaxID=34015 RepID=A0A2V3VC86_9SPHN|nr:hypothetical protein [Blastomonas natatoria]PXW79383.1 hypothetical protein C7451_101450 [Blastomonas natatoria]
MRVCPAFAVLAALALLPACQSEPGFDEKFEQQSRELSARAQKIETETRAQLDAAREAEQAAAEFRRPSHPEAAPQAAER